MESWNFHRLFSIIIYIDDLHFGNHSWKNECAELKKFKILYFFWPSTKGLTISYSLKMKSSNFHRLCRRGKYFYNLHFFNHTWKNDCAELEKVKHFTLLLTFHKGAHHFLTVKDWKLKFSQIMQIKEIIWQFELR